MGISSNQARLMTLTARQHDLELRAQQISAQKMIKGLESQEAAMNYSKALQNYSVLKQIKSLPARNCEHTPFCSEIWYGARVDDGVISYVAFPPGQDVDDICDNYYTGSYGDSVLSEMDMYDALSPEARAYARSQSIDLYTSLDEEGAIDSCLQIMKGQYERFTASISAEEKLLDMELTQINTEHSAVKTEYDSVKGLVGENVDKSFNVFS